MVKNLRFWVAALASVFAVAVLPVAPAMAWGGPCSGQTATSITGNFNGTPIPAGSFIWFNAVMKLKSPVPPGGADIFFSGQTITFTANGATYSLNPPDSEIEFSTSATTASTVFVGGVAPGFVTTVPASFGDNVFLSGLSYQFPSGLPGGIHSVTWSGTVSGAGQIQWQWAAAVYSQFTTNYNSLGIKPTHSTNLDAYQNGDQAGTPENFKQFVIGGATGGGGSNWTGSYSGTASASASCAISVSTVTSSGSPITGYTIVLYASDGATVVSTCFSACSFNVAAGSYFVGADSYGSETFSQWSDGTVGLHPVTVGNGAAPVALTAVYSP
jgi:hypothetical protein